MPFLAKEHFPIPNQDLLSWMFDNPKYDEDMPIYIDAARPERTISCRQARKIVRQLAAGLKAAGIEKGDCVSIHSFNDVSLCSLDADCMPEAFKRNALVWTAHLCT